MYAVLRLETIEIRGNNMYRALTSAFGQIQNNTTFFQIVKQLEPNRSLLSDLHLSATLTSISSFTPTVSM